MNQSFKQSQSNSLNLFIDWFEFFLVQQASNEVQSTLQRAYIKKTNQSIIIKIQVNQRTYQFNKLTICVSTSQTIQQRFIDELRQKLMINKQNVLKKRNSAY
ncbi:hypothetical protein ABPG74_020615 [Tetrahymena malaccensis]